MKNPKIVIPVIAFLLFLGLWSMVVASYEANAPQPNGETLSFEIGETKAVTNDSVVLFLTRNASGWTCEDNGGGEVRMCVQDSTGQNLFFFHTDKIGEEDLINPGTLILYGEWEYIGKGG